MLKTELSETFVMSGSGLLEHHHATSMECEITGREGGFEVADCRVEARFSEGTK